MMRRGRYETREATRETILRGRYRENYVPKSQRREPKKQEQQGKSRHQKAQQQRDERSTSSTEKSSLYNYNTDQSSQHTQQTDFRTNLSKPSLSQIAESSGATLVAAAISPFDEDRRGSRELLQRSFFDEHDDGLRESPSDELPLNIVEKAIDTVVDAACGNVVGTAGVLAGSLLARSYLETEAMLLGEDGIIDPTIPNPSEGLRQEVRPVYEAASFPTVTFREVKLDPKKTVASTAMRYPDPPRSMRKPRIPSKASAARTKARSPIRSVANRVKSAQTLLFHQKNRPIQESSTKKAEYLDDKRASKVDRYTRARAHSDASDHSRRRAEHRRLPFHSQESREDMTTKTYLTSVKDSASITLALHECPSVRELSAYERTNRAQHNRSSRRRMRSDETDTSDPSLPPRLPLHKNRPQGENPSDEISEAHHCRAVRIPSTVDSSFSSVEKCDSSSDSSSSSASIDLIPQVSDYILPQDGPRPQNDIKEQISMLLQEHVTQVERIAIIRERRIQSDPIKTFDDIGKGFDPPTIENDTAASRKTIKRRRAVSQPNPLSDYQRMAELFVPLLYRILSKYQRKSLEFQQENETAIVPRCSSSQEYVLSEFVNLAVLLMQQNSSETFKQAGQESRRKPRRRRKRSSVLDELWKQISVLDQKLLELTNDTGINDCAAMDDQDPFVESGETPFIEQIKNRSDNKPPPEVVGSLDGANDTELFGELQTNDPEFKDLIEMAYVVTDLSRDEFIDAHHMNSVEGDDEDDYMEQELTNLSFFEEIIQSELSQVDSGEGTYQDASVAEEIIDQEFFQVNSGEDTYHDESFVQEIIETEVLPDEDDYFLEEIFETRITQGSLADGTCEEETPEEVSELESVEGIFQDESVFTSNADIEASNAAWGERDFQEDIIVEEIIETEVSQVYSSEGMHQKESIIEGIIEKEVSRDNPHKDTYQEECVIDLELNNDTEDAVLSVFERQINEMSKKGCLQPLKEPRWEDDMFPDDELQVDAVMFPDDELQVDTNMFPDDEMNLIDKTVIVATPITVLPMYTTVFRRQHLREQAQSSREVRTYTALPKPEQECEKSLNLREDEECNFPDLLSLPSDERVTISKPSPSDARSKYVSTEPEKERSSLKRTSAGKAFKAKGEQFESRPYLSLARNMYKNEALYRSAEYIPREKEVQTISSSIDHVQKEKEAIALQPALMFPSTGDHENTTVESAPSDEASENFGETGSVGGELADKAKETKRNGLETSVVACTNENQSVELVVALRSPMSAYDQAMHRLEATASCETEESDPICAAVNRKLAEVRENGIPDPDDEMIMDTIGMSMSTNSASKTPRFTASGVVPDPDDEMIMETFLSPPGPCRQSDSNRVESDADRKIVMETVYFAESEMVTEKLFTVSEEGTTSSSPCNASRQASTGYVTDPKLEKRQKTMNGRVREAINKFNGGVNSAGSSHEEDVCILKRQKQSQKDKFKIGSQAEVSTYATNSSRSISSQTVGKTRQQTKRIGSHPKSTAAALIARFEQSLSQKSVPGAHPIILKDEDETRASSSSTRTAPTCDASHTIEIDSAIERSEISYLHGEIVQSTDERNTPLGKTSCEPREEACYDEIPNLLSASSVSQPESPKRQGGVPHSPPKTKPSGNSVDVPNSPSKGGESMKTRKIKSKFSWKKSRPTDTSASKKLEHKVVTKASQNDSKKDSKLQSKTPSSSKRLPLHGFVNAASKNEEPKKMSLIDKVKPPVHLPSKNFSSSPLDFEALNESLIQVRRDEKKEEKGKWPKYLNGEEIASIGDESTELPITELQLKEMPSLVSELDGPKASMFSRGMCNCLGGAEEKSLDCDNSIEQLKKVGQRKKDQQPLQTETSNVDEIVVSNVFSMDGMLDENMQRTADAAVKALELVLARGAASAAAAIKQTESQPSCFRDCMTPMTEGSFNAFSQAVIPKTEKKRMIQQENEGSLTLEDNKSKLGKNAITDTKFKFMSKERKKPDHDPLALTDILEYGDTDDWAQIVIQENNVEDMIESLRSKSSELDPFMCVSFDPSTPRGGAGFSPISSDWTGSAGRLGVVPMPAAQRDAWSKRNLLSGTTTLSSDEGSDFHLHQYEDGGDFDARQVDIDFHFESPASSIRGPYDRMIKKQQAQQRGGQTPTSRTNNRSIIDPPSGRRERTSGSTSTQKREAAGILEKECNNKAYNKEKKQSIVTQQKQEQPEYYDFPAPPSQEISELTMSQEGDMTLVVKKSQDPVKTLKSFQEMENREGFSCSVWLYDSKKGASKTEVTEQAPAVNNEHTTPSSIWCSESFGTMIQDCFATSQPTVLEAIKEVDEEMARPPDSPSITLERHKRAPDAPATGF